MVLQQQQQHATGYGSIVSSPTSTDDRRNYGEKRGDQKYPVQVGLLLFGLILLIISMITIVSWNPLTTTTTTSASFTSASMTSMTSSTASTDSGSGESTGNSNGDSIGISNPIIDILQQSSTIIHPQSYYKNKVDEYPSLYIDMEHERQVYNGHTTTETTSLTISWTNGQFHTSPTNDVDILIAESNDRNIIALLCGDTDSHLHYVDAKYVSDFSDTSRHRMLRNDDGDHHRRRRRSSRTLSETGWYYGGFKDFDWWGGSGTIRDSKWHTTTTRESDDDSYSDHDHKHTKKTNVWYIESLPQYIIDQRKCQAILYYYIHENEYVILNKSKTIHT